jgi:hypothetical protein
MCENRTMTSTEYLNYLGSEDRMRVRIETERGRIIDFTIQYETVIATEFRPVVRYDLAHGYAHRDILDPGGAVVTKEAMPSHWTMRACLDYANADIRRHWRMYREAFRRGNQ